MISSSRTIARASRGASRAAALAAAWLALAGPAAAAEWPAPAGYLNDFAGVVDPASGDSIRALASELAERTGAELAVVTVRDLGGESIESAATELFDRWGMGKKGRDDGVLILLALEERRIRIEVGYGLEGILPDGRCGEIIRRVMGPDLSAGRFGAGLSKGAAAVAGVIAADRGIALARGVASRAPESGGDGAGGAAGRLFAIWVLAIVIAVWIASRRRARARHWGGWRTRRRGWHDPWGGFGGLGGFGGFGGGGGGGGFGGFGGGSSGGGGASGRF